MSSTVICSLPSQLAGRSPCSTACALAGTLGLGAGGVFVLLWVLVSQPARVLCVGARFTGGACAVGLGWVVGGACIEDLSVCDV